MECTTFASTSPQSQWEKRILFIETNTKIGKNVPQVRTSACLTDMSYKLISYLRHNIGNVANVIAKSCSPPDIIRMF